MVKGNLLNKVLRRLNRHLQRYQPPPYDVRCVTKMPAGEVRGRVLLAYVLDPFINEQKSPNSSHTHHAESLLLAQAWLDRGYIVDAIDYLNIGFQPQHNYDVFVSARVFFDKIAARLNAGCLKVVHLDTSHFAVNNKDAFGHLAALQERRGISLPDSIRLIETNHALEAADCATVLGNAVTTQSYAYANKTLYPMCVPAVVDHPNPVDKDMTTCRHHFIWLGSNGLLHKGLDLVLEAFAELPELQLTVCGPLDNEPQFVEAYQAELALPNVHAHGWIDVASTEFKLLADSAVGLIYPSCREGQAGAVVNCVKAGLIPIVSKESGVDTADFGETLERCSVATVKAALNKVSSLDAAELTRRTQATWHYGDQHFSPQAYLSSYGTIVDGLIQSTVSS